MAIIRLTDLRAMDDNGLLEKLEEVDDEVRREQAMTKNTGKPSNAGKLNELKKVRARIKTILHSRGTKV